MSERSLTLVIAVAYRIFMLTTKDKIILGAVQLFVEQGVAQTTTREIASRSQVAEGSIYRYFPSKDEMAWQIFSDYHHQLAATLQFAITDQVGINQKINALVNRFLQAADEDWLMFRYYLTAQHTHMHKIDETSSTPYQVILKTIEQGMHSGDIQTQDPQILAAMAMGAVHQVAINKLFNRIRGPLLKHNEYISNTVCRIVLQTS